MSFNQSLNLFNQQKQTSNDNFLDCVKAKCLPPLNPQNGKTLKNYYKQISISKEEKRKDFSKNKWFVNKQNGQILKMKNIELYKMLLNQSKQLQFAIQQIQYEQKNSESIFLTLTLPPLFHSKMFGGKVINKSFGSGKIQEGYKILRDTTRQIQKTLSKKKIGYKFVKVIEPHKDLTCHLHIQYFLNNCNIKEVEKTIQNIIDNRIEKNILGNQYDLKILENEDKTNIGGYITKYMLKTLDNINNNKMIRIIDGWKRHNKIRMFSNSNPTIPKSFYNYIVGVAPEDIEEKNLGEYSLNHIRYINTINNKTFIKHNPKQVDFTIHKIGTYQNKYTLKELIYSTLTGEEVKQKKVYKRRELKIYDKECNKIKTSMDWTLLEKEEEKQDELSPQSLAFCIQKVSMLLGEISIYNKKFDQQQIDIFIFEYDNLPLGCVC